MDTWEATPPSRPSTTCGRHTLLGALACSLAAHVVLAFVAARMGGHQAPHLQSPSEPIVVTLTAPVESGAGPSKAVDTDSTISGQTVPKVELRAHRSRRPTDPTRETILTTSIAQTPAPLPVDEISQPSVGGLGESTDSTGALGNDTGSAEGGFIGGGPASGTRGGRVVSGSGVGLGSVGNVNGLRARYLAELRERLASRKQYPYQARRLGLEGTVYVRFSVGRDGAVNHLTLSRRGTDASLESAAIESVRTASPFPPPPPELGAELTVEAPIVFVLEEE